MTDITVLNSKYEATGKLNTMVSLGVDDVNIAVVHQVVKATLAGRRQGTVKTKTKGEVSGGGAKPFKQKGTGRARQGSTRSILMPGGGTAFGPSPRDYTQKINKKMMNIALQSILADKLQSGKLTVIESVESTGKTKQMHELLSGKGLLPALVVTNNKDSKALRAVANLQHGFGLPVEGFSVYEAVRMENLIIEKEALERLLKRLV